jgi:nucleoside-diphosphate-sugar epimerase
MDTLKILVTGGSGRIGLEILKVLQKSGHDVVDFDMFPPKLDVEFIKGDLRDRELINDAVKGIDAVIHLAAFPTEPSIPCYEEGWDVNCTGAFNVFDASVKHKVMRLVYASSICATGILTWTSPADRVPYFPVDEDIQCRPQNLYGVSKLLSEQLAYMYSKRSSTTLVGLRIATVWFYSNGIATESTKNLVDKYVKDPSAILKKQSSLPNLNINALKDLAWQYVGVLDVAEAFRRAVEKDELHSGIFNIGAANTCSNWDSIKLAKYFYPDVPILSISSFVAEPKKPLWSIEKARRELDYKPKFDWKEIV